MKRKRLFILCALLIETFVQNLIVFTPVSAATHSLTNMLCAESTGLFVLIDCPAKFYTAETLRDEGIILVPKGSTCVTGTGNATCGYDTHPKPTDFLDLDVTNYDEQFKTKTGHYPGVGERIIFINKIAFAQLDNNNPVDDWTHKDCSLLSGIDKIQCEAIQKCIKDNIGNQTQCISNWENCIGLAVDPAHPTEEEAKACAENITTTTEKQPTETCQITGIGWIICPIITFLGKANDSVYSLVNKLLVFQLPDPFSTDATKNPTYSVWSSLRSLANVLFVIAFFIVILSQATNFGISAYGVRKMLPRIIMAAIFVNLSYYICIFGIDVSNILGAGMDGLLSSTVSDAVSKQVSWEQTAGQVTMAGAGTLAGLAMAGAVIFLASGTFFAVAASGLLAALAAVFVLMGRQVGLIFCIILSPVAFAAYILPNTESLFSKWRKTFMSLLMMYPLIALLFAGTKVASQIILMTHSGDIFYGLFAAGVLLIPLFAVPWIAKVSGGMVGRMAGMVNDRGKGFVDRARNFGAKGAQDRRGQLGYLAKSGIRAGSTRVGMGKAAGWGRNQDGSKKKGFRSWMGRRAGGFVSSPVSFGMGDARRKARAESREQADAEYQATLLRSNPALAAKFGGVDKDNGAQRVMAKATAVVDALDTERVKNEKILVSYELMSKGIAPEKQAEVLGDQFTQAVQNGKSERARAIQEILAKDKGAAGVENLEKAYHKLDSNTPNYKTTDAGRSVRGALLGTGIKAQSAALDKMALSSNKTLADVQGEAGTYMSLNAGTLMSQTDGSFAAAVAAKRMSVDEAQRLLDNQSLEHLMTDSKRATLQGVIARGPGGGTPSGGSGSGGGTPSGGSGSGGGTPSGGSGSGGGTPSGGSGSGGGTGGSGGSFTGSAP